MLLWLLACANPALLPCDEEGSRLEGMVVDMDGTPIEGASIRVGWSEIFTDENGRFRTPEDPGSRWVTAQKEGYVARSRAARPDDPVLIRLHEQEAGHVQLVFAGDVMAGRRFIGDKDNPGTVDPSNAGEDLWELLKGIQPLFEHADFRSINLEGPLLNEGTPLPNQDITWKNPPELAQALVRTGINVANIANNHISDYGAPGIVATTNTLNQFDIISLGAGADFDSAWSGQSIFSKGNPMAMVSCSILYEDESEVSIAATTDTPGVAECTVDDLRSAIIKARQQTDFIVVQIHGGVGYTETPSYSMQQMVLTAGEAGAALVVGHGPHVLQSASQTEGAFVFWSLGNFLFDQTLWSTLPSGVLQLDVDGEEGTIERATFEPLVLRNYAPRPVRGSLQNEIAKDIIALSELPAYNDDGAVEFDLRGSRVRIENPFELQSAGNKWSTPVPLAGDWLTDLEFDGDTRIGRDLLRGVGNFETLDVGDSCGEPVLWDVSDPRVELHSEASAGGDFGIRHKSTRYSIDSAHSRPLHRIPLGSETDLTLLGELKGTGLSSIEIRYYAGTSDDALKVDRFEIEAGEEWEAFAVDFSIPDEAQFMLPFVGAKDDLSGSEIDLDNLALIAWSDTLETNKKRYDWVQTKGTLTATRNRMRGPLKTESETENQ